MTSGISLFLIAVGAILYFAVNATVSGLEIDTVGLILMIVGAVGFLWSILVLYGARDRAADAPADEVIRDGAVLIDGNRVEAIGPAARVRAPAGAKVIDVRGKTIVPADGHARRLELVSVTQAKTGVLICAYRPVR